MKVAIVTSTFKPELSGIAETVYKRVKILSQKKNMQILVLAPDYSPIKDYLPDYQEYTGEIFPNVLVKSYPSDKPKIKVAKKDGRIIQPFWKHSIEKELEAFKPDVIHVDEPHRLFGAQIVDGYLKRIGINYGKKHNIPVAAMWHTDYFKYSEHYVAKFLLPFILPISKKMCSWVYNSYDQTICNSAEAKSILEKLGLKKLKHMNSVGIDLENFTVYPNRKNTDTINLLYIGRITPEKKMHVMFNSFLELDKKYDNLKLHVIGDGPEYDDIFGTYGREKNITFYGRIKNEELPKYFSMGDIFINPSDTETFTQTAAEAAACSLPLVLAAGGGNFEMVKEGYNGYLFEPDNHKDLSVKLERLIQDQNKREAFSNNSREVAKRFCHIQAAQNFYDTWQELITAKS